MKKIYPLLETLFWLICELLFIALSTLLFVNYEKAYIFAYICIVLAVLFLLKLFSFPSHIVILNDKIKIFDFPFFATNKFYIKKSNLVLWNSEIDVKEVEKIDLVKLSKEERKKHIGHNHLFNRYLRVRLKYGKVKYIYIGGYTKAQSKRIMKYINDKL